MIPMSDRWNEVIFSFGLTQQVINLATVQISLGEAFADNRLNVTTSAAQPTSKLSQLNDGELHPDYQYAALDGRWKLGDGKRLSSEVYMQTGYRGWTANSHGTFSAKEYIRFTFESPKQIDQVDISFDPVLNEYAPSFRLVFYSDTGATQQIDTWSITGNTQAIRLITTEQMSKQPVAGVQAMELVILTWSVAGTYAKVTECFAAKEEGFSEENRLVSIDITYQSDSTGNIDIGSVYASKATIVLDNSDRYFSVTDPYNGPYIRNKRVDISLGLRYDDGTSEYCTAGVFYVDNLVQDPNGVTITINAQDIMREFSGRKYIKSAGLTYPASIAQIFEDAIIASGLPVKYQADAVCSTYIVPTAPAWTDSADCRQVLKLIAQAINGRVYQDRLGTIRLEAGIGTSATTPIDRWSNPVVDISPDVYFTITGKTSNVEGVTRVTISGSEETEIVSNDTDAERRIGTVNYPIQNNPIFKAFAATQSSLHKVAAINMLAAYNHQAELRTLTLRSNPALEVGDVVRIMTMDGVFLLARIAQYTIRYQGGMSSTMFARAQQTDAILPTIRFYEQDGELHYEVDPLFASFFSASMDLDGNLVIGVTGPLRGLDGQIDSSGHYVWSI